MFEKFEGFGHRIGFGTTPAVVVVDFINAFTDPNSPLGSDFSKEVEATNTLLQAAREKNIPIFFTTVSYEKSYIDAGNFIKKVPAMDVLLENTAMVELDSNITRIAEKEPFIVKKYASSFFGTSLHSMLAVNKVDTLIVIGVTTSGCVRATAVDGLQYGYRIIIPVECVGDRSKSAHEANLYDLNTKYADVMSLEDVIENLNSIDIKTDGGEITLQNKQVLIVGAGPVGLSMAIGLAKKGLSSIVLEKRSSFELIPKASTIHAPTMEIFEEWGVIEKLLEEGLDVHELQYWDRATNEIIASFNLDLLKDVTSYPFRLQLEQSRIQQIFEEHFLDSDLIDLRFNHTLKSFEQTEDKVIATIESNDEEFQITADVLIGADGASSTVRKLMNVDYEGFTYDKKFLVIGVTDHDFKNDHPGLGDVSYFFDSKEFLALIHNHSMWKFMFNLDSSIKNLDDISEDFMQEKIQFFSNVEKKFNIAHKTVFNVHQRVAKNIFDRRVVLIGDAAHVNNPLGGMGMNSGIHDAYFLANDLKTLFENNFTDYQKVLAKFQHNREQAIQAVQRRTVENEKAATKSGNENPLEKMVRISSDPVQAKKYLMQSSMIDDFNLMKQLNSVEINV